MSTEVRAGKVGALEGLRGLASFCVVLHHLACALFPALIFGAAAVSHHGWDRWLHDQPLLGVPFQGNFMVCVFFVLSGYVLGYRYIQTGDRTHLWSGLVRRYPRLMIPAVASCVLAWAVLTLGLFRNLPAARLTGSSLWLATWWGYPANLLNAVHEGAVSAFSNGPVLYNSALWTMWNELLGSLLVYGTLLVVPRRRFRWVAYVALAGLTATSYLLAFVIGMAFCELMAVFGDEVRRVLARGWWVPFLAIGLYVGGVPIPGTGMAPAYSKLLEVLPLTTIQTWVLLHVLGAAAVVLAVLGSPLLRRGLETTPLRWLGRTSFGLYLVHMVVIGTVASWLVITLVPRVGYMAAAGVAAVATVVVSLGMAELFTRWVDAPTIQLSGRAYRAGVEALRPRAATSAPSGEGPGPRVADPTRPSPAEDEVVSGLGATSS
jgi:peptidoglycan/LPS O-acetylase OafA/YrhL